jgi:hypothetical protein
LDILFGGQKELQVEVPAAADGQVRAYVTSKQAITAAVDHVLLTVFVSCMPVCLLLLQQLTVRQLLPWTRDTLLQDRPELFMKGDTV